MCSTFASENDSCGLRIERSRREGGKGMDGWVRGKVEKRRKGREARKEGRSGKGREGWEGERDGQEERSGK